MAPPQVVIITKKRKRDLRPPTAHVHRATLKKVTQWLEKNKIIYEVLDRNKLPKNLQADLILAIGGDGTIIAAAHVAGDIPILGVNSAPQTSIGFFCTATPINFESILKKVLAKKMKPTLVPRLRVHIDGKAILPLGLNDVLFASRVQGETARYRLCVEEKCEEQKSSGLWIATGAGSTAAIYSAGGKNDKVTSKKLQYLVREPFSYLKNPYRLTHGFLKPGEALKIVSQMNQGMIFIDGAKWFYKVQKGSRITIEANQEPVKIYL